MHLRAEEDGFGDLVGRPEHRHWPRPRLVNTARRGHGQTVYAFMSRAYAPSHVARHVDADAFSGQDQWRSEVDVIQHRDWLPALSEYPQSCSNPPSTSKEFQ